jgi:glycosyltransferase involved in cell wall biosynthesis
MRILIDLQGAQNGSRHRGIGRYSLALSNAIARNAGEHRIFILLSRLFSETIEDIRKSFFGTLGMDRFLIFTSPGPVAELRSENSWRRRTAEILREYFIETIAPDAVLITSMVEGAEDDTVTSLGILRPAVPTAAILYDLIPLMDPDHYLTRQAVEAWYRGKIDSLCRCDALFAISHSAANEAIRLLKLESTRIRTISSAADSMFFPAKDSFSHTNSVAKRLGIVRPYLMHSSAFEPRKNFQGLIRAYAALPKTARANHQLVLVCKLETADRESLRSLTNGLGLALDEVVLPGFVADGDLVELYRGCHLFVFPSFHEGFGLPALEAMSCGAPTIGSNVTSIPEVIGRNDALFDPASFVDISALILKALSDPVFYQSLKCHAKTQAAKFSWDETALNAIDGMENLRARHNSLPQSAENAAARRKRMLEALAEVARETVPSDFEILELARSIEANSDEFCRVKACGEFSDT